MCLQLFWYTHRDEAQCYKSTISASSNRYTTHDSPPNAQAPSSDNRITVTCMEACWTQPCLRSFAFTVPLIREPRFQRALWVFFPPPFRSLSQAFPACLCEIEHASLLNCFSVFVYLQITYNFQCYLFMSLPLSLLECQFHQGRVFLLFPSS